MFKFVALIRQNWDRLAASITLEQGKTFSDARGDILRGLQVAETACGITTQLTGEVLAVAKDMETRSYREPLGFDASICPFSFPAMIPLWSIPIATITGNTLVLRPSERDPGAALILAELAKEAGFPDGVINIIHGTRRAVNFILDEPSIKAISFVGGNAAGEYVYSRGSANDKRVQANLGAKNHAVVLPDCHKQHAINAINGAAFGAAGQRCMSLSTLILIGKETHAWMDDVVAATRELNVNGGFEEGADLGPVISPQSLQGIESLIVSAEEESAEIVLDGRGYRPEGYEEGNFLEADTLAEAMNMVNENPYGNGVKASAHQPPGSRRISRPVRSGLTFLYPVPCQCAGNKKSIVGGGINTFYGKPGLNFYKQTKTVTFLWKTSDDTATKVAVATPSQR
ncbi:aldehyde dehydrogenase (NADP(+)) ald6 [Conoideocrella luteorostrata]|uniref:Aldehyde dehydrogenase (NADP(+)) ald6 n=1 Tax=Conoideocrella luteorostrata TaxID=1105319 RepID=A0AAJ0D1I0_9HYPO|nr:aldehyde dehydrogenase (NADP(+)) ald6 [Conoideocrella luteorostrata]